MSPDDILAFWFGREGDVQYGKFRPEWFAKNDDFDQKIRQQFLSVFEAAERGELDAWAEGARSALALTIVLDQFPRNMFRGEAKSFAADAKALSVTEHAIARGLDRALPAFQRSFLYMPLMHAEDLTRQRQSVALFSELDGQTNGTQSRFAKKHMEIIERFGRFPHRNAVLGRESTPEEKEFLRQPGSSF
jgi:uncharacterized protein (DUF924 family)